MKTLTERFSDAGPQPSQAHSPWEKDPRTCASVKGHQQKPYGLGKQKAGVNCPGLAATPFAGLLSTRNLRLPRTGGRGMQAACLSLLEMPNLLELCEQNIRLENTLLGVADS